MGSTKSVCLVIRHKIEAGIMQSRSTLELGHEFHYAIKKMATAVLDTMYIDFVLIIV